MFERFTSNSREVISRAQRQAVSLHHDHVGTEHLLLGLVENDEDSPAEILESLGVSADDVMEGVLELAPVGAEDAGQSPQFTAELKKTLELALRESLHLRSSSISNDHLLIGLLRNSNGTGTQILRRLVGDLNLVRQEIINRSWWWDGRVAMEDGVEKRILEYPDIRPFESAQTDEPRPKRRPPRDESTGSDPEPIPFPDFDQLVSDGIEILEHGLPELPGTLDYFQPIPVAYWKGEVCGTVLFLYYLSDPKRGPFPCGFFGTYVRNGGGWTPREGWSPNDGTRIDFDPITSPESVEYVRQLSGRFAYDSEIHWTGAQHSTEPAEDEPAILVSGRHGPHVAEISFIQGDRVQKAKADGHFGLWIACTDRFEPYRIEAHDDSGAVVGFLDEPLDRYKPDPIPLEVITPTDLELPHQYGGKIRILKVERYEESVGVEWHVTLVPDPDVQLAEQLERLDQEPDQAWSLERIEEHVKLIDGLKLVVLSSHVSLTDDLGTDYKLEGFVGSTHEAEATGTDTFEPTIPNEAAMLTVRWEDLTFEIPLG